jgi:signal transduction histidine kinase
MMEDLSLHILDLAENAMAAGARRIVIAVNENERRDLVTVRVTDDGRGMTEEELERALDPFSRPSARGPASAWPSWPRRPGSAAGTWSSSPPP